MKVIRLLIVWFFSGYLFIGCYQKIDLSVPFEGSKMVLNGYLSPQKGLDLWIKKTFDPYQHSEFGEDGYFVAQARVVIWQNGALIDSCREIEKGHYLSFHPERYDVNAVYEVRITTPKLPEVTVRDIRIPGESLVESDQFSFRLEKEKKSAQLKVVFQNPDHYALYYGKAYYDSNSKNFLYLVPSQEGQTGEVCDEFTYIFSNKCKAGSSFNKTLVVYPFERNSQTGETEFLPKDYLYFEVGQIDPRYKNYIEKSDSSDEPFIEPDLDQGNAEGGYGFIVGWNTKSFTYKL